MFAPLWLSDHGYGISIGKGTKLSEDCCRYGSETIDNNILAKALNNTWSLFFQTEILEPLRAMITGAPLEDARHLAQRYSRMRHEAETQAAEVARRQARAREMPTHENSAKLQAAEVKMQEIKANMVVLGKEAVSALAAVEAQQQRLTFQRLVSVVEGEKLYHQRVAAIFSEIEALMVSEKQRKEAAPTVIQFNGGSESTKYFLAEAIHAFDATSRRN